MTYAVVPALRHNAELAKVYEPLLTSREYDPELKVPAAKAGITAGMSMTEKQGGSDVRAGTTQAVPNADGSYTLTGPQVVHLGGDERHLPGSRPGARRTELLHASARAARRHPQPDVLPAAQGQARQPRQRLREIEYDGATAWLVGEEGRGVPTIIEMVNLTRLDCTLGSATSMRSGLTRAIHHAQHRKAFGAYLIDQPLMRMCSPTWPSRPRRPPSSLCGWPAPPTPPSAVRARNPAAPNRLAAAKYWVCKRATPTRARRWNAWAATATPRSPACRGCTARRR